MPTQFDDAFLRRLAQELMDIRTHIGLLRTLFGTLGVSLEAFDRQVQTARTTSEFQLACEMVFHILQGDQHAGH